MRIIHETEINGAPKTWFVTELRIESNSSVNIPGWWGLWIGWWLYKPSLWKEWLWEYSGAREGMWRTRTIRVLGFEVTWQLKV